MRFTTTNISNNDQTRGITMRSTNVQDTSDFSNTIIISPNGDISISGTLTALAINAPNIGGGGGGGGGNVSYETVTARSLLVQNTNSSNVIVISPNGDISISGTLTALSVNAPDVGGGGNGTYETVSGQTFLGTGQDGSNSLIFSMTTVTNIDHFETEETNLRFNYRLESYMLPGFSISAITNNARFLTSGLID
jgi:hypothetical protein